MTDKELRVSKISSGTVIDHVRAGQALNVLAILGIDGSGGEEISIGMNVPSDTLARKDVVKVEGRELSQNELDVLSIIAPDATINIVRDYDVQPPNPSAKAGSLSGGNQQKFIVGREIEHDPDVMIASHPTRGVDIGSIESIHDRLVALRDEGLAIVVVSSKLDEIQQLSDRIAVMYEGEFIDTVDPTNVTEEELGLLMAGRDPDAEDETAEPSGAQA